MAINKRKILQSAQKNLQKGAFDKALKDYKTLLEADPKDVNLRLKVGDVYLKQGKSDEAVAAYTKVAERFMKDGFDAKAVALYKQITKIDSKRVDVYVPLAELYQRLGLISDAMGALQTAADAHYREGDKPAALELLRKMATLDPANTTSRLKVAELLRQEGMTPEALAEFEAVAEELERQEEIEGRVSVLQKILELEPDQGKALEGLARAYLVQRKWSQAEEIGARLSQEIAEFAVEGYEVLVEALTGLGRDGELPALYQSMAQAFRERGDEDRAREIVQRYCGGTELSAEGGDLPLIESDEEAAAFDAAVGGDGAFGNDELDDPGFVTDSGLRLDAPQVERDVIDGRRRASASPEASNRDMPLPPIDGDAEAAEVDETDSPAPEGDPEQLVAEASVYLRYGKSERAIESLRAALAQEPQHVVALEKLGEALQAGGDSENAVRSWLRGAEAAAEAGDAAAAAALEARVAEIDPSAVPSAPPPSVENEIESEDARGTLSDEDDIEIEIDDSDFDDDAQPRAAAEETETPAEDVDTSAAGAADETETPVDDDATDVGLDGELELDDELVTDEPADEEAAAASAEAEEVELEIALPGADEELDADGAEDELDLSGADEAGDALDLAGAELPEAGAEDEELDLTEDEFLTDEPAPDDRPSEGETAEEAAAAPVFDEALSDELATDEPVSDAGAAEGAAEDVSEATDEPSFDASLGDEFVTDEPVDDLVGDDVDVELPPAAEAAPAEESSGAETGSSTTPQQIVEELEEGEFYLEQGMLDEAAEVYRRILAVAPHHPQAMVRLGEIEARQGGDASGADTHDDDEITGELPQAEASVPDEGLATAAEDDASEAEAAGEDEPEAAAAASETDGDDVPADDAEPEAEGAAADEGDFDLAAELSDVFDDDGDSSAGMRPAAGTEEEGFEQVFAAFKAGVDKELGDEDHEARYDLGIAYKEMGLLEDAIGEFRVAMQDPERQLQSLHMMSMCALDLERPEDAVAHLEQALALPELPEDQQIALRFDLGRAEEARGDRERARAAWEAVVAVDPNFLDVGERLEALDREPPPDAPDGPEATEEAFESFDDLIDESAAESEAAEEYESFDDLMGDDEEDDAEASGDAPEPEAAGDVADVTEVAEVTAEETAEPALDDAATAGEPQDAEPAGAAEATAQPVADDEPEPDPEPPPKKRRRKKISFM